MSLGGKAGSNDQGRAVALRDADDVFQAARPDLFERQRRLMDDWAAYLAEERGQVVAMRR